eukprot:2794339-Pleurochrysis_carterae.AAC.2
MANMAEARVWRHATRKGRLCAKRHSVDDASHRALTDKSESEKLGTIRTSRSVTAIVRQGDGVLVTVAVLKSVNDAGGDQGREEDSVGHERDERPRHGRRGPNIARRLRRVRRLAGFRSARRVGVRARGAEGLRRALRFRVDCIGQIGSSRGPAFLLRGGGFGVQVAGVAVLRLDVVLVKAIHLPAGDRVNVAGEEPSFGVARVGLARVVSRQLVRFGDVDEASDV